VRIENSFVPVHGVGEKTERRLWREGITHWDDFEPSSVGRVQGENIADYIERARKHLAAGDSAFFDRAFPSGSRWRLYENFRENACFFDIETTGLNARHSEVTTCWSRLMASASTCHSSNARSTSRSPSRISTPCTPVGSSTSLEV
jgi:hypothetical protein